jgi:hypothetical protein
MAEQRPSRTKKSSAAVTDPDNTAAPAIKSHRTAAEAAKAQRLLKSQAVTQPPADDREPSNDSNLPLAVPASNPAAVPANTVSGFVFVFSLDSLN